LSDTFGIVHFPDPEIGTIRVSKNITSGETHEKSRFTESQIAAILKEVESGLKTRVAGVTG
jgi:hypothetical protein